MKTQKYSIGSKSNEGYFLIFAHCLNVALVKAYVIYIMLNDSAYQVHLLVFNVTACQLKTDTLSKPSKRAAKFVYLSRAVSLVGGEHNSGELLEDGKESVEIAKKSKKTMDNLQCSILLGSLQQTFQDVPNRPTSCSTRIYYLHLIPLSYLVLFDLQLFLPSRNAEKNFFHKCFFLSLMHRKVTIKKFFDECVVFEC